MRDLKTVLKRGLEPLHPCGHYTLNVARLPIPPLQQFGVAKIVKRRFNTSEKSFENGKGTGCQGIALISCAIGHPYLITYRFFRAGTQ